MNSVVPFFSIVIATYNSEKTLSYTLQSINTQDFPRDQIEVIVVDGGSTDSTLEIARNFGCVIYKNKKRLPEYAKGIGIKYAKGRYVIRMDSDEEFSYPQQLNDKKKFLECHPEVKVLMPNRYISGRKELCGISAEYMNILGDPFSYFVYKTKCDKYETYKKNITETDGVNAVMHFSEDDVLPLIDSACSVVSLEYLREVFPDKYYDIDFVCSTFDIVISKTGYCGCIKGDDIKHNCSADFLVYLKKLRFRVVNNIFHKEESGFSSKEDKVKALKKRKLLFCVYSLLIPLPLIDSIRLALKYKKLSFLLHFIYLYYVAALVFYYTILNMFGRKKYNSNYGKRDN